MAPCRSSKARKRGFTSRRLFEPLHEDIESFRAQSDDLVFGGTAKFSEIVCRTVDGSFCTVCVVARVCHGVELVICGKTKIA